MATRGAIGHPEYRLVVVIVAFVQDQSIGRVVERRVRIFSGEFSRFFVRVARLQLVSTVGLRSVCPLHRASDSRIARSSSRANRVFGIRHWALPPCLDRRARESPTQKSLRAQRLVQSGSHLLIFMILLAQMRAHSDSFVSFSCAKNCPVRTGTSSPLISPRCPARVPKRRGEQQQQANTK